jgi:hypothetical protein
MRAGHLRADRRYQRRTAPHSTSQKVAMMHYAIDIHSALELAHLRGAELRAAAERDRMSRQVLLRRTRGKPARRRRRFWPALHQA